MDPVDIYAIALLAVLALLWAWYFVTEPARRRRREESERMRRAMLLAWAKGEDFRWPPKEE